MSKVSTYTERTDKQKMWDRLLPFLSGLFTAVIALGVGLFFIIMLFWPYNPLTINSIAFPAIVQAGTTITYHTDYCRTFVGSITVSRAIIGSGATTETYPYPSVGTVSKPGCGIAAIPFPIPSTLGPGTYIMRLDAVMKVNPFRTVNVIAESNVFTVTK